MHFFIVNREAVSVSAVILAEGFTMITGDHHESAVAKPARAKTVKQRSDLCIRFTNQAQIVPKILLYAVFPDYIDKRLIRANRIGIVRLVCPSHQKKGMLPVLIDPLDHPTEHESILGTPG